MDDAQAHGLYLTSSLTAWMERVGEDEKGHDKADDPWGCVKFPFVQILVVVAIIQMRTLKAEEEKGSIGTVIGYG